MREADEGAYLQFLHTIMLTFLGLSHLGGTKESEATMHWKTIL